MSPYNFSYTLINHHHMYMQDDLYKELNVIQGIILLQPIVGSALHMFQLNRTLHICHQQRSNQSLRSCPCQRHLQLGKENIFFPGNKKHICCVITYDYHGLHLKIFILQVRPYRSLPVACKAYTMTGLHLMSFCTYTVLLRLLALNSSTAFLYTVHLTIIFITNLQHISLVLCPNTIKNVS